MSFLDFILLFIMLAVAFGVARLMRVESGSLVRDTLDDTRKKQRAMKGDDDPGRQAAARIVCPSTTTKNTTGAKTGPAQSLLEPALPNSASSKVPETILKGPPARPKLMAKAKSSARFGEVQ